MFYHDHALGITRLNVYDGLAGFYLLKDDNEEQLIRKGIVPEEPYDIGLFIQDRMFKADGQIHLLADPEAAFDYPHGYTAVGLFFPSTRNVVGVASNKSAEGAIKRN